MQSAGSMSDRLAVSDEDDLERELEARLMLGPVDVMAKRCPLSTKFVVALTLLFAAAAGLLLVFVSLPSAPKAKDKESKKEEEGEEIPSEIEGLFAKSCSSCNGQACQCGWAQLPGACRNYESACCWHCCCNHMDHYQDGSSSIDWWQYNHTVDEVYQRGFDCNANHRNDTFDWSGEKAQYCCLREGIGCACGTAASPHAQTERFECAESMLGSWSPEKKAYCCEHAGTGCQQYHPYYWHSFREEIERHPIAVLLIAVSILSFSCFVYMRGLWLCREEEARRIAAKEGV